MSYTEEQWLLWHLQQWSDTEWESWFNQLSPAWQSYYDNLFLENQGFLARAEVQQTLQGQDAGQAEGGQATQPAQALQPQGWVAAASPAEQAEVDWAHSQEATAGPCTTAQASDSHWAEPVVAAASDAAQGTGACWVQSLAEAAQEKLDHWALPQQAMQPAPSGPTGFQEAMVPGQEATGVGRTMVAGNVGQQATGFQEAMVAGYAGQQATGAQQTMVAGNIGQQAAGLQQTMVAGDAGVGQGGSNLRGPWPKQPAAQYRPAQAEQFGPAKQVITRSSTGTARASRPYPVPEGAPVRPAGKAAAQPAAVASSAAGAAHEPVSDPPWRSTKLQSGWLPRNLAN